MIAVAGYFKSGNFGDDWLYEAWLQQNTGAHVHMCTSAQEKNAGPEIVTWRRGWPRLRGLSKLDRVVFLGGLLQDFTSRRSFFYYLACACFARTVAREGLVFDATSIGPLKSPLGRRCLGRFLRGSPSKPVRFFLRDRGSYDILKGLCPNARAELRPDPTWNVPLPNFALRTSHFALRNEGSLGIFLNGSIKTEAFLRLLAEIIRPVKQNVALILSDPSADRWQAKRLSNELGYPLFCFEYHGDTAVFLESLSHLARIASFRLHGAIAAMRLGLTVASINPPGAEGSLGKLHSLIMPAGVSFFLFDKAEDLLAWSRQIPS